MINYEELRKSVNFAVIKGYISEEEANTILTDKGAAEEWLADDSGYEEGLH